MKDSFYISSMKKTELAVLYFPESDTKVAVRHLMRWINGCPPLLEDLATTGYHVSQKIFTSRQVLLISDHLGSP